MNLRIHRLALLEIDREVGHELEDEIDARLAYVLRFPQAAPVWRGHSSRRVVVVDRFPFTMPYHLTIDQIVVLALAHTSRRPGYWTRRT